MSGKRDWIESLLEVQALDIEPHFLPYSFDPCIVGLAWARGVPVIVYDKRQCSDTLDEDDTLDALMSHHIEEAERLGRQPPIFVQTNSTDQHSMEFSASFTIDGLTVFDAGGGAFLNLQDRQNPRKLFCDALGRIVADALVSADEPYGPAPDELSEAIEAVSDGVVMALAEIIDEMEDDDEDMQVYRDAYEEQFVEGEPELDEQDDAELDSVGDTGVVHDLKTWPKYFDAIRDGYKSFDIRKDDRGYCTGDRLRLRKFDPDAGDGGEYLPDDPIDVQIIKKWDCSDTPLKNMLKEGHCVLQIKPIVEDSTI